MKGDGAALLALASSVADGEAVDWTQVAGGAGNDRERALIDRLRIIAAIGKVHQTADEIDAARRAVRTRVSAQSRSYRSTRSSVASSRPGPPSRGTSGNHHRPAPPSRTSHDRASDGKATGVTATRARRMIPDRPATPKGWHPRSGWHRPSRARALGTADAHRARRDRRLRRGLPRLRRVTAP